MRYAVIRRWKNNLNDFQVVEYVSTYKEGLNKIVFLPKSEKFEYEVMIYT